jgi:serine/threonine protein kinase
VSVEELFLKAVELPPTDRPAFLDQACAGDPDRRASVEALLRAHEAAGSVLEQPLFQADPTATYSPPTEAAGAVIDRYKLVEPIGEGGMGEVWLAHQTDPVKRLVALKVIKAGMDTKAVLARFEAERQALALMDHPNIAKVLDGGATPGGRPYFVMELVKGTPITTYCDEHRLTPRQRLELFVPVCQAVQHAHQKGIIHRDLKPSNVLVAPYDGKPVVKVIDFGVAKAAGVPLTDKTLVTGFGAVVGTPEYMSPEQAELNNADIDTRSDVYSLGILLYELLTGSTPLTRKRAKEAALFEVLRLVREEEPPRPSNRLSTTEELPRIAASRGLEPKKLSGVMRGELDWIVMRALEKERSRRYETANGFGVDIQRYLAGEPVQAVPPSARYRLLKFLRRNRVSVAATFAVFATLVAGIIGTSLGLVEARRQADAARKAADEEAKARAGEAEQRVAAVAAAAEAKAAEAKAKLKADISYTVFTFTESMLAATERMLSATPRTDDPPNQLEWGALDSLAERFTLSTTELATLSSIDGDSRGFVSNRFLTTNRLAAVARMQYLIAKAYQQTHEHRKALKFFQQSLLIRLRESADEDESEQFGPVTIRAYMLGSHQALGEYAEAESDLRALLDYRKRRAPIMVPPTLQALGHCLVQQHKYTEAETVLKDAAAVNATADPRFKLFTASRIQGDLGAALTGQGRWPEAEQFLLLERASGDLPGPLDIMSLERLVELYRSWGHSEQLEKWSARLSAAHAMDEANRQYQALISRAHKYELLEDFERAEPIQRKALEMAARMPNWASRRLGCMRILGNSLFKQERLCEAEAVALDVIRIVDLMMALEVSGIGGHTNFTDVYGARKLMAEVLSAEGRFEEADPLFISVYECDKWLYQRWLSRTNRSRNGQALEHTYERMITLYKEWGKHGEVAKWQDMRDRFKEEHERSMNEDDLPRLSRVPKD